MLEVIRLGWHSRDKEDAFMSRDIHLLQAMGMPLELALNSFFAPIDEMFQDDAPLLPLGFCIIPLESKSGDTQDALPARRKLDFTSSFAVGLASSTAAADPSFSYSARAVLTIAFQFPCENYLQKNYGTLAC